ncbi:nucleotide sugar dehydrogenase [Limnofasciculus baicalensis]|uniref:UDP-glucose 6-dehydrogenase n=1 Tax=Limnofasciculus baicalensis BBK-W-15 TaxID=2699891 RepID=A0AAE3KMA9_9CYAN|nr:UDP-glucose/GDP-mannose dehydrogenase family protein [Limnofasciculus baicalensis]MCP2728626.1 UDP-glucose/GDP-mannose dehydrogenase family protein [Limnofasciculus baicalensis BBK-W-15]
MKISIFGLGYVGAVTAACLARDGHEVIGVDVSPEKVALIGAGESPIVEPELGKLLAEGVASKRIRATTDAEAAVIASDASLISVGTPSTERGETDLSYVFNVCKEIGSAIRKKSAPHAIVLRSTVPPGTLDRCHTLLQDTLQIESVHLAFNPEFLREGSAIRDYDAPPYTIIGTEDPVAEDVVRQMYAKVNAPVIVVKPPVAEMVKFVANTWHAAKVSFANEIGRISKGFEIDGREVMNIIVQDTKLNLSSTYMRPGFAYGGSCLPKDLRALLYCARTMDVPIPLLNAIPATNTVQIDLAVQEVLRSGARQIAVFGLAFKSGTDDLRESPSVLMVKRLLGEGCQVKIYDKAVQQARLVGTNLAYIQHNLPHFEALLVAEPQQAMEGAEMIVVTYATAEFRQVLGEAAKGTRVLDLVGIFNEPIKDLDYQGIAW